MKDPFVDEVLAQLAPTGDVRARGMFGGAGLYIDGMFFGLVANGCLYFRVDDASRTEFEAAGCHAFQPFPDKPAMSTYWSVPDRVRNDRALVIAWTHRALEAARVRDAKKRAKSSANSMSKGSTSHRSASKKVSPRTSAIPNVGPVSRRWLAEVGVTDLAGLQTRGSVATFLAVRATGRRASVNLLYALEGALLGLRWDRLPDVVRANLRERAGL